MKDHFKSCILAILEVFCWSMQKMGIMINFYVSSIPEKHVGISKHRNNPLCSCLRHEKCSLITMKWSFVVMSLCHVGLKLSSKCPKSHEWNTPWRSKVSHFRLTQHWSDLEFWETPHDLIFVAYAYGDSIQQPPRFQHDHHTFDVAQTRLAQHVTAIRFGVSEVISGGCFSRPFLTKNIMGVYGWF